MHNGEIRNAVEDVTPGEEATKHLIVQRVQPLAAEFERVIAGNDREIVLYVRAPQQLIDGRLQEERISEAESGCESHRCVRRNV